MYPYRSMHSAQANGVHIVHCIDSADAALRAGACIADLLKQYRDAPVMLLSSGGSSLSIFEHIPSELSTDKLTISVTDERWGEHESSNFHGLAHTAWFQESVRQMARVIDSRVWDEHSLDLCAMHFGEILHMWKDSNESGKIIAVLGVREDGQIASIGPMADKPDEFTQKFIATPAWAVGYEALPSENFPKRITVTIPFLRLVDHAVVYACGNEKKEILYSALRTGTELHKVPASIMMEMTDVHLFSDCTLE